MTCSRTLVALHAIQLANPKLVAQVAVSTGALTCLSWWVRRRDVCSSSASLALSKTTKAFERELALPSRLVLCRNRVRHSALKRVCGLLRACNWLKTTQWQQWRFAWRSIPNARRKLVLAAGALSPVRVLFATTPAAWRPRPCSVEAATALSTRWYFARAGSIRRSVHFTSFSTSRRQAQKQHLHSWQARS